MSDLLTKSIGDSVYKDCVSSMGASSCGDVIITAFSYKYDENSGEKYTVIHTSDEDMWDSRNGAPMGDTGKAFFIN